MTYALRTLGCKLNQADSAAVAGRLGGASNAAGVGDADLILLNTCTVTHKADREARRLIRSLRRENPRALVVVMGCAAKRDADAFRAMPEVDAVLDSDPALESFLDSHAPSPEARERGGAPSFGDRTRALLKVQEGCNFPCSYCIVPAVRGLSRSVPPEQVESDFKALLEAGFKEVVITGVNTGEYGKDLGLPDGLPELLELLLRAPGRYRIRLNSIEPRAVTPALISILAREPRLCCHLQIPMQSGSDKVLRDMRRNYDADFYEKTATRLADGVPGIGLGADVLLGFPTESDGDFDATLALLGRLPLAFIHAFSFSPRPGTPAADLPLIPQKVVAERAARVRELGRKKMEAFARSQSGCEMEALTLAPDGAEGRALTGNFLRVALPEPVPANRFVPVRIGDASGGRVEGSLVRDVTGPP